MKIISEMFASPYGWIAPFHVRNRLLNHHVLFYCVIGHTLFIPVFFLLNRDVPLFNNILCVGIDILCLYLNSKWRLKAVYVIFSMEISLHTFFCSLYFGFDTGFLLYYLGVIIYIFLQRKHYILRIILFSVVLLMLFFNYVYLQISPPSYPDTIIPLWLIFWLNAAAIIVALMLVASQFTLFIEHAENAILKAKEKAEEGERAKSVFLANMSHEIRSPLNSIVGMINLAILPGNTQQKNEYLEIAKHSADHLQTVINDILDYSKIEENRMALGSEVFSLHQLVKNTICVMDSSIYHKDLEMKYEIGADVPEIFRGDPARIRQVLINLISNAIKFTEEGSITLGCELVSSDAEGDMIKFSVEDTGSGIPENMIDSVFNRFTQLDHGNRQKHVGTGLGLAISKELVELMGGRISVESLPGRGSIFSFTIPLERAEQGEGAGVTEEHVSHVNAPGRLKILIAEDIFTNWLLYEKYMNMMGHTFTIVENGRRVLEELERNRYDLILMDLEMPELDGLEAVKIIRKGQSGADREIPVIAMTGYSLGDFTEKGNEFDDYITKPIEVYELEKKINDIINNRSSCRGLKPEPAADAVCKNGGKA